MNGVNMIMSQHPILNSVWKFSPGTAKRPKLDWTKTEEDWKISGLVYCGPVSGPSKTENLGSGNFSSSAVWQFSGAFDYCDQLPTPSKNFPKCLLFIASLKLKGFPNFCFFFLPIVVLIMLK